MTPVTHLITLLKKHMAEKGYIHAVVAQRIGLSSLTISYFLRQKVTPQRETIARIEDYLRKEGVDFRIPVYQKEDREQLEGMGIMFPSEAAKKEMPSIILDEKEKRMLIYSVYHGHFLRDEKDALLDKLLPVLQ